MMFITKEWNNFDKPDISVFNNIITVVLPFHFIQFCTPYGRCNTKRNM